MSVRRALQLFLMFFAVAGGTALAAEPVKVVYQFSEGLEQAKRGLNNIKNHLAAEPGVKIVAVAFGPGVDFLVEGAEDKNKNPFNISVEDLAARGVEFRVCNNTLTAFKIDKNRILPQATIVPAGVAEIARLQSKEGYAYIKP
jgi:intracellular sulfur oxidation DsrE/DsrF family protein